MNCAEFENTLAELMGGDLPSAARSAAIDSLRKHVTACSACRGGSDLVELVALPAAERQLVQEPGSAYWASFDERLMQRIAEEEAQQRRYRTRPIWAVAAVAVILLAVVLFRVGLRSPVSTDSGAWGLDENLLSDSALGLGDELGARIELPAELALLLDEAADAAIVDGLGDLGDLAGLVDPWAVESDAAEADNLTAAALALLDDWTTPNMLAELQGPLGGFDPLGGYRQSLGPEADDLDAMFPNLSDLEPETRREILEWLRRETAGEQGVS